MSQNTLKPSKNQLREMRRKRSKKQTNSVLALNSELGLDKIKCKRLLKDLENRHRKMYYKWIKLSKQSAEFCARRKAEFDKECGTSKGSLKQRLLNMYKIEADKLNTEINIVKNRIEYYKNILKTM